VVLGIITVMTSVSLSFMGDKDEKHRYQESIVKLKAVQRNFLSVGEYQGQIVASGFLIDNGLLFDATGASLEHSVEALLGTSKDEGTELGDLELLPFAARKVWVNTGDTNGDDDDAKKVEVEGSQMFKGVRPGLFDLSEYRDSSTVKVANIRGAIKDAWGDKFVQNTILSPAAVEIEIKAAAYKSLPDLPPLPATPRIISFSQENFLLSVSSLSITLKNVPDTTTSFKVALVSFNNEATCVGSINESGCWHTIKTDKQSALASDFDNMFRLTQVLDPTAVYDDAGLHVVGIFPVPSLVPPLVSLTDLVFTDSTNPIGVEWSLFASDPMRYIEFEFSAVESVKKISAGSHLVVVLCENITTVAWDIYSPTADSDCNDPAIPAPSVAKPVFEYIHLLPGVAPSPIVIALPEPSL
jgi:hypothetical protein